MGLSRVDTGISGISGIVVCVVFLLYWAARWSDGRISSFRGVPQARILRSVVVASKLAIVSFTGRLLDIGQAARASMVPSWICLCRTWQRPMGPSGSLRKGLGKARPANPM